MKKNILETLKITSEEVIYSKGFLQIFSQAFLKDFAETFQKIYSEKYIYFFKAFFCKIVIIYLGRNIPKNTFSMLQTKKLKKSCGTAVEAHPL